MYGLSEFACNPASCKGKWQPSRCSFFLFSPEPLTELLWYSVVFPEKGIWCLWRTNLFKNPSNRGAPGPCICKTFCYAFPFFNAVVLIPVIAFEWQVDGKRPSFCPRISQMSSLFHHVTTPLILYV